ncbi:hypothetical protein EVAR_27124_1 [Eumeta japonica]|uniref:Uncharacterized protein n=1 Tax=Eumeta variegata TaxID=151549 RepID=A0A4C1VXG4_EUMVA|nr:hypothetical protein EVAR_27124_1 [Eumeta japonica]
MTNRLTDCTTSRPLHYSRPQQTTPKAITSAWCFYKAADNVLGFELWQAVWLFNINRLFFMWKQMANIYAVKPKKSPGRARGARFGCTGVVGGAASPTRELDPFSRVAALGSFGSFTFVTSRHQHLFPDRRRRIGIFRDPCATIDAKVIGSHRSRSQECSRQRRGSLGCENPSRKKKTKTTAVVSDTSLSKRAT